MMAGERPRWPREGWRQEVCQPSRLLLLLDSGDYGEDIYGLVSKAQAVDG